ncbi:hypothetical protein M501DRAFT_1012621 [Patellaria atrata CBS 101060]|uniref:Uncharacterized protein n=1 Tax=Patellaria atrata CBS 101060 TaxID=1346257 RepID=A0A9P4SJ37_9PEZI|nr:hypothetical protein M501DRAFT_1012621 [Patellaria atrata CBS 101060]
METHVYKSDPNILLCFLYFIFTVYHAGNKGKSYRATNKALSYHTVAGIVELLLYYGGYQISVISLAACLVHSISGMMLVKNLRKGYPTLTRPMYQGGSVLRAIAMIRAYYSKSPIEYHDAIVPIHSFVYARSLFFILGTIGPTPNFLKNANSKYVYAAAIYGAALVAVGHCVNQWAILQYMFCVHAIGKLNFWTRRSVDQCKERKEEIPKMLKILQKAGLCSFPQPSDIDMQITLNDGPRIGFLRMDSLGHIWAKSLAVPDETLNVDNFRREKGSEVLFPHSSSLVNPSGRSTIGREMNLPSSKTSNTSKAYPRAHILNNTVPSTTESLIPTAGDPANVRIEILVSTGENSPLKENQSTRESKRIGSLRSPAGRTRAIEFAAPRTKNLYVYKEEMIDFMRSEVGWVVDSLQLGLSSL